MTNKVLGGGSLDGSLGLNPDFSTLTIPLGRVVQSVDNEGYIQYWIIEETLKVGGNTLANGLYANRTTLKEVAGGVSKLSVQNRQAIEAAYKAQGYNNVFFFEDGFTYTESNDVGIYEDGTAWTYADAGALPVTVAAGTVPSEGVYKQVTFSEAQNVTLSTGQNVQGFADSFALKIFQSPTDGGLTEISTRTVDAGEVYEVRKSSDDSLATIYSDAAGTTEIVQNGTSNVSNNDGVVEFFVADGDYYVGAGPSTVRFTTNKTAHYQVSFGEISKISPYVNDMLRITDRDNSLWVVTTETPNNVNILSIGDFNIKLVISNGYANTDMLGLAGGVLNQVIQAIKDDSDCYTFELNPSYEWELNDTLVIDRPLSIVSKELTKIRRNGNVDTWRSCFHVETSNTYFDNLYLYSDYGFNERAGITYGENAGENNRVGTVQGAYWRLGVVYPKDTTEKFTLNADKIRSIYDGRAISTSTPNTPFGAININQTEGIYSGFVDVSGGSLKLGVLSVRNRNTQAIKKGNEAVGGDIHVGVVNALNGYIETRLNMVGNNQSIESKSEGIAFTGLTSGATGELLGFSRDRVDLINVTGIFQNGETVSDGVDSYAVDTVEDLSDQGLDEGILGNGGTHFDSYKVDSLNVNNYPGDLLWILNHGTVDIGSITARNIKNCRHIIRYSPFTNGADASRKPKLNIGSLIVEGANMQNIGTYFPIYLEGNSSVSISSLDMTGISASTGTNFISCSAKLIINALNIDTSGGNWSRFLNFSGNYTNIISNADFKFDSANRLGTVSAGRLYITTGTSSGSATFDGAGAVTLTAFDGV